MTSSCLYTAQGDFRCGDSPTLENGYRSVEAFGLKNDTKAKLDYIRNEVENDRKELEAWKSNKGAKMDWIAEYEANSKRTISQRATVHDALRTRQMNESVVADKEVSKYLTPEQMK